MTLALSGKSRKRQGALLLAALLAIFFASLGAVSLIISAAAHSLGATLVAPTCINPDWSVKVFANEDFGTDYWEVTISTSGSPTVSVPSTPYLVTNGASLVDIHGSGSVHSAGTVKLYSGAWDSSQTINTSAEFNVASLNSATDWGLGYVTGAVIKIGSELMQVTGKNGHQLSVARGFAGTDTVRHKAGAITSVWARNATASETKSWNLDFDADSCTTPGAPVLTIETTADSASVPAGSPIGFTITLKNTGADASGVHVTDTLPSGFTWSIADQSGFNGVCTITGSALDCPSQTAAAGATQTVHVTARTDQHSNCVANIDNIASYTVGQATPVASNKATTKINCADVPTPDVAKGNARIVDGLAEWDITVTPGSDTAFDVTGTPGSDTAFDVTIADANTTLVSPSAGCSTVSAGNYTCHITGSPVVLAVSKPIPDYDACKGTSIDNSSIAVGDVGGKTVTPAYGTTLITIDGVAAANCLSVTKTVDDGNYVITMTNTGPAASVLVMDTFDAGTTGETLGAPSVAPSGTCSLADLTAAGCSVTVPTTGATITVPFSGGAAHGCADLQSSNFATVTFDGTSVSGSPTAEVHNNYPTNKTACHPGLHIAKSGPSTVAQGSAIQYTLTVSNTGSGPTTDSITVTDTISGRTGYSSASGTNWSCGFSSPTITCTTSTAILANSSAAVITVNLTAPVNVCGQLPNVAHVSGGGVEGTRDSNTVFTDVTGCTRKVTVCKVVDDNNDGIVDEGTFTLSLNGSELGTFISHENADVPSCVSSNLSTEDTFTVTEPTLPAGWMTTGGYPIFDNNNAVAGTSDVTITVVNKKTPATQDVTFTKYICPSASDVPESLTGAGDCEQATTSWTFNIDGTPVPTGTDGTETITLTADQLVKALGSHLDVTETPQPGYALVALRCTGDTGGSTDNLEWLKLPSAGTPNVQCTAYNRPLQGQIIVKKVNIGGPQDDLFIADIDKNAVSFSANQPSDLETLPVGMHVVSEEASDGYTVLGYAVPAERGARTECPAEPTDTGSAATDVAVADGEVTVVCFYNNGSGHIKITKIDQTSAVTEPAGDTWHFAVSGGSLANPLSAAVIGSGSRTFDNIAAGTGFTAKELESVTGECPGINETGTYRTKLLSADTQSITRAGQTIEFTFVNQDCSIVLGTGTLIVNKVSDTNGNGTHDATETTLPGWSITITGPDKNFIGGQTLQTNSSGQLLLPGITDGTYTVTEEARPGYTTIGSNVDGDSFQPAVTTRTVQVVNGETHAVTFFNQPFVNIHVTKSEVTNAATTAGSGWKITVAGCGNTYHVTTNASGIADFANLPPCATYTVSEDLSSKSGFAPAGSSSKVVSVTTPGSTANVSFTNVLIQVCTTCGTSIATTAATPTTPNATPATPTATSTTNPQLPATPTTPTAMPATPTATSTTNPQQHATPTTVAPKTKTPTTTDVVLGEKTPGPGSKTTPVAPRTGSGLTSGSSSMTILLAVLGVFAISSGLAALALGNKRRN